MFEPSQISHALGGKKVLGKEIYSGLELADLAHKGFPVEVTDYLLQENILTKQELFKFVVPHRTLERRKHLKKLSPEESDKLARFIRMREMAAFVFGESEGDKWLREPNAVLGGKEPLFYLDSDLGAQIIETLLGRIAHGIPH